MTTERRPRIRLLFAVMNISAVVFWLLDRELVPLSWPLWAILGLVLLALVNGALLLGVRMARTKQCQFESAKLNPPEPGAAGPSLGFFDPKVTRWMFLIAGLVLLGLAYHDLSQDSFAGLIEGFTAVTALGFALLSRHLAKKRAGESVEQKSS